MDPPDNASRFRAAFNTITGARRRAQEQEGNKNGTDAATADAATQEILDTYITAMNTVEAAATQIDTLTTAMNHAAANTVEAAAATQIDDTSVTSTAMNNSEKFEDEGVVANTVEAVAGSIEKIKSKDPTQIVIGVLEILSKSAVLVYSFLCCCFARQHGKTSGFKIRSKSTPDPNLPKPSA